MRAYRVWETRQANIKAKREQMQGLTAHAMGNYVEAANHFTAALDVAKHSTFLHLLRADCGLRLDNYMLVRYDTTMVLQQDPASARALALLGRALFDIVGQVDAATSNLRHCLRYNSPGRRDVSRQAPPPPPPPRPPPPPPPPPLAPFFSSPSPQRDLCSNALARIEKVQELHAAAAALWAGRETEAAVAAFEAQLAIDKRSPLALAAKKRLCVAYFRLEQPGRTAAACEHTTSCSRPSTADACRPALPHVPPPPFPYTRAHTHLC